MKKHEINLHFEADGIHAGVAEFEWNNQQYRAIKQYEDNPDNPWEAWCCQPPVVGYGGRNYNYRSGGADNPPSLTYSQIMRNHREIERLIKDTHRDNYWTDSEADEFNLLEYLLGDKPVEIGGYVYTVEDLVAEVIDEYLSGSMDSEMLDRMEEVWEWADVRTWRDTLVGYSQGDWIDTLLVATPEWVEKSKGDSHTPDAVIDQALENAATVFGAYMFGDVYGVTVEKLISNGDDDAEWEEVESCWGFYGYNDETSGLAQFVRGAVADWQMEAA
jgi:hypothetical protein